VFTETERVLAISGRERFSAGGFVFGQRDARSREELAGSPPA